MKNRWTTAALGLILCFSGPAAAQTGEEENPAVRSVLIFPERKMEAAGPQAMTRDEFQVWKEQRADRLRDRLTYVDAQEGSVDPEQYVLGPGDELLLNVWGSMELQVPLFVSPEGILFIPSVGSFDVSGETLAAVQADVEEKAGPVYKGCRISLNLLTLRFFRVHVVGEVKFPGTYVAQAVHRVSDLILEAGYVTDWAWRQEIELRHQDGRIELFDLDEFERMGDLEKNPHVAGGAIIYVPSLDVNKATVRVEGEFDNAGLYQIRQAEDLMAFLQRIRALDRNSDLTRVRVIRADGDDREGKDRIHAPFLQTDRVSAAFPLQDGDRIILPSSYVYVKGAVQNPGAYPFAAHLTARDYAGMAGGDYRSGNIRRLTVWRSGSGRKERGMDIAVGPGDVVEVGANWNQRLDAIIRIVPTITSLILAAKAAGFFDNN